MKSVCFKMWKSQRSHASGWNGGLQFWKVSSFAFERGKQKSHKANTALACGQKRSLILCHCFSASAFAIAKSLCFGASCGLQLQFTHSVTVIKQSRMEGEYSEMSCKKCLLFSECRCIALVCGKQAVRRWVAPLYTCLMTLADILLPCGFFCTLIKPNSGIKPP